ncbi:hypothetical protein HAX54_033175 [Datura stramonium]|uniref:Thaumatin-like protein n=1 Tax=Datura stramonium TaxID=4076 RepID=A0ABS8VEG8_DATST|nr:hypothetical protein [Datura stramonium]
MCLFKYLSIFIFLIVTSTAATAAIFEIRNNCSYTVWAAAVPGGGRRLDTGEAWMVNIPAGTTQGRIWARTGCNFDESGKGKCQTGDCNGLLECQGFGAPPNTLAEYALNQFGNSDFFDISLVDGFNLPMEFSPTSGGCTGGISCTADINGQCPDALRTPGGCNNPCTVFKTDEYCCTSGTCGPTSYSTFFKNRCPSAYSYPQDDTTSTFTCPEGANYKVVFCPTGIGEQAEPVIDIRNNCPFTVWAAAVPGGGQRLEYGEVWRINTKGSRIWGRTNCNFDESGRGHCQTGDCDGLLKCQDYGTPPNTLALYTLNQSNYLDFFNISLVNGFNLPMDFLPTTTGGCTASNSCTADIIGQCPKELRTPGGCNNPCTVFQNKEYCCTSGECGEMDDFKFFEQQCPNSFGYPREEAIINTLFCPAGTNYTVVFCP